MKDKTWNYKAVVWSLIGTVLVIMYLLLTGCEKLDDPGCYDCYKWTFQRYLTTGKLILWQDTVLKCDYSALDAQRFEDVHTLKATPISTCGDVIRWSVCICEKIEE
jgi:hypothetical protein